MTIFTPYLDRTAKLVLDAGVHLSKANRIVVTGWDIEALLQSPSQLMAMRDLLRSGYELRSLEGLHAKVLLTDESLVTVGSQNFTQRGRRNKEATSFLAADIRGSDFSDTLTNWLKTAEPIDEDLVNQLIEILRPSVRQHTKVLRQAEEIANRCRTGWRRAKEVTEKKAQTNRQRIEQARIKRLEQTSKVRLRGGAAFAELRMVGDWENRHETLLVYSGSLTDWETRNEAGEWEPCIERLSNYPAYFPDTGRMGFVRVASTRITYIRKSVSWTTTEEEIAGHCFKVAVSFPAENPERANILIELISGDFGSASIQLRFRPPDLYLHRLDLEPRSGNENALKKALSSLSKPRALRGLLQRNLKSFVFAKRLGTKNVREFIGDGIYRISAVEFESAPVLVVSKVR